MTNPPQGSDEPSPERGGDPGTPPVDPDQQLTQPTPFIERAQPYVQPAHPYGRPVYGFPAQPAYGPPDRPAQYGTTGYVPPPQYGGPQYGGPQYGAPGQPYGAPAGTPREKSRVGLIAIVTGIVLLVIVGVVVLVMSLQSAVLDPAAVERDVAAQFQEREGVAVELTCADTMAVRANATYTCSGTTVDGELITLHIAITDVESAAYRWSEP
jgi:hypothetical protein